jgi:NTP pyrophosphatase (non-canonical NTP hydrolase)
MRKEVETFAHAMEYKLGLNDHKGGWEDMSNDDLFAKLRGEVDELQQAIEEGNYINILLEAADVANYALMIAWNAMKGALK